MSLSEMKRQARELLKGKWNRFAMIYFVYLVLYCMIIALDYVVANSGTIGAMFFVGQFALSFAYLSLKVYHSEEIDLDGLFYGFKFYFKALWTNILMGIYIVLWCLLLIIPGIIAAYSYSMTFFVLADNPELSAGEAISMSKRLMKGHKWEFFSLTASFLGWALLSVFTLGIGLLWVIPYMSTSTAVFYNEIKQYSENQTMN
ncbi:MAG TPA: DUF975 family protein [Candidatus Cloacimonadota bacterium]|nr:DUF975 family protein [Candidatus Cloacimonadota bacterium]